LKHSELTLHYAVKFLTNQLNLPFRCFAEIDSIINGPKTDETKTSTCFSIVFYADQICFMFIC